MDFNHLKKNLKKDFSALKRLKVAVLADTASQFFAQALKGYGYEEDLNLEIFEGDYNAIDREINNPTSDLYQFEPEFVVIFHSTQKLLGKFCRLEQKKKESFGAAYLERLENMVNTVHNRSRAKVICFTLAEIDDAVFGNYAAKRPDSFICQLRTINLGLMKLAQSVPFLFVNDLALLQARHGYAIVTDDKIYVSADMALALDFLPIVAKNTVDIILAVNGRFKKCLILDLDNTIWGGVIGDDGLENIQVGELGIGKAFTDLQLWIKQLKERGIILAVCSKNEEQTAREPFEKHPDMVLRLDDIAVFVANWKSKAENIAYIQSVLNIGYDSMVFLDDNHVERAQIKAAFPDILAPDLPQDPAEYLTYLRTLNIFEAASLSEEDGKRTKMYQEEHKRAQTREQHLSLDDYLRSLRMVSETGPFTRMTAPRVAQLTQRSNQFNLRTVRYTDADIERIMLSPEHITITFSLEDVFGSSGLVSAIILEKKTDHLFIDTWIMSCRVLQRGMEEFALNTIVCHAAKHGFGQVVGEYRPTAKNVIVKDLYERLGFAKEADNLWRLPLDGHTPKITYIRNKESATG